MACLINYNKDQYENIIREKPDEFSQELLISLMEEAHYEVDCINDERLTSLIKSLEAEIITRPHHHHTTKEDNHDDRSLERFQSQVSAQVDDDDHMDFCMDIDHDDMIMTSWWYNEDGEVKYDLGVNYNLEGVSNLEDITDGYLWQLQEPYYDVSVYVS